MKHKGLRFISLALLVWMILSLILTACTPEIPAPPDTEGEVTETDPPESEYTLPKEPGHNQITFYWAYSGEIKNADVWVWWDGRDGQGYLLHECEYGAKAVVNVPIGIKRVGFIVRRDCSDPGGNSWGSATKDYAEDRFAVIEGSNTFVYLKTGDATQYTSTDGGKTLSMIQKINLAGMTDFHTIRYVASARITLTGTNQVKVYENGAPLTVTEISDPGRESVSGFITVAEVLDLTKSYEIEIEGCGRAAVIPTKIFDCAEFLDKYTYDGDDLGASLQDSGTTFKVWAPTASRVVLDLYRAGNGEDAYDHLDMVRDDSGVWSHRADCGHGTYYTYTVTTALGTQTASDPYGRAAGLNGDRSMVVDLSRTDPVGWAADTDFATGISSYSDAVIWEVHVRDFSNKIASSQYKGKYLAFTERGLVNEAGIPVGVDYLVQLGITHVHLLPVYDYATVDEGNPDAGFNWGYDPKNYNVPEGSYSTDPWNGEVRIREFKEMVRALHEAGIGVIMDVVYNHTYDANSSFNRIVPYYYYRYSETGVNTNASGCGNDTASERYMFGKFMADSVRYWAKEYHLDGFRFDLMGLHDLATMQNVETAIHEVNPEALIYGEGWTMGATMDGSPQANQGNISRIEKTGDAIGTIAVFNDVIRDGLKGSVFQHTSQGYINGAGASNIGKVRFGISGGSISGFGWKVEDAMVINYMSAHDNHSLWDKLSIANAGSSQEERAAMNRLGAAILMISRGTPFFQAGEEMLRSKDGNENSYNASDAVNNIRWELLTPDSNEYKTMQYYKGLIEMRKAHDILRKGDVSFADLGDGRLEIRFGDGALAVINPADTAFAYTLDGEWHRIADENTAGAETIATEQGEVQVSPHSVRIYVKE